MNGPRRFRPKQKGGVCSGRNKVGLRSLERAKAQSLRQVFFLELRDLFTIGKSLGFVTAAATSFISSPSSSFVSQVQSHWFLNENLPRLSHHAIIRLSSTGHSAMRLKGNVSEPFALESPFFMFYTFRLCLLLLILILLWLWKGKKRATFYWRKRRAWRRLEGLTARRTR